MFSGAWRLLAAVGWLTCSCGASSTALEATKSVASVQCTEPVGDRAAVLPEPPSKLGLTLNFSKQRLRSELGRPIPQTLAQEQGRRIGALGRVNVTIKRGPLNISVENDRLSVGTRLRGEIEVCKPIGPICMRYGSCRPTWDARVSLELAWAEPAVANTQVKLTDGCVLRPIGYDATAEVRRITRTETQKAAKRINRELRQAQRRALSARSEILEPLVLPSTSTAGPPECLSFDVTDAEYSLREAGQNADSIAVLLQVRGALGDSCAPPPSLPSPTHVPALKPETHLTAKERLSFEVIEQTLSISAGAPVRLRAIGEASGNQLYVGVPASGACSTEWYAVIPTLDSDGLHLETPESSEKGHWLSSQIIAKPERFSRLEYLSRQLMRHAAAPEAFSKQYNAKLTLESDRRSFVQVDQDSLSLRVSITGIATVNAP